MTSKTFQQFISSLSAIALVFAACAGETVQETSPTATESSALYGNEVTTAPGNALPHGPVGQIFVANPIPNALGSACSATLVGRDTLITAGHCFCMPIAGNWTSQQAVAATTFTIPATTGQNAVSIAASEIFWKVKSGFCNNSIGSTDFNEDIACVKLASLVPLDAVPSVQAVHTGSDFIAKFIDSENSVFNGSMEAIGYGGTVWNTPPPQGSTPIRRTGPVYSFELESSGGDWIQHDDPDESGLTTFAPGDSGGPLSTMGLVPWTVFAVASGHGEVAGASDTINWSPTWDNGLDNGKFLRDNCIDDDDNDGVSDNFDNCTPDQHAVCDYDPASCKNFDQADSDGDGVGDVCDNCLNTANADQLDSDGDGRGNICDNCIYVDNFMQTDSDGDGVGNGCDNCALANPYASCTAASSCPCVIADGQSTGHCLVQQDDQDNDGLGGPCDVCPNVSNETTKIFANSNDRAESRENKAVRGDLCDATPTYISRPIVEQIGVLIDGQSPILDAAGDDKGANDVVLFDSAAAIGSETNQPHAAFTGKAGFRHCDCRVWLGENVNLEKDACFELACPDDPTHYGMAAALTPWKQVTISTGWQNGVATNPPSPLTMTFAPELSRTFNGAISEDPYMHPETFEDETTRIGAREVIGWHWRTDALSGNVESYTENNQLKTVGLWWDHVPLEYVNGAPKYADNAPSRDASSFGLLRDHYAYVTTPLAVGKGKFGPGDLVDCSVPGCVYEFRPWLSKVNPAWDVMVDISEHVSTPVHLQPMGDHFVLMQDSRETIDVTQSIGAGFRDLLRAGGVSFLQAVETEYKVNLAGGTAHALAVPANWRQDSAINEIFASELGLDARVLTSGAMRAGNTEARYVPADRMGARMLFSATENSMFMIGGRRPTGQLTGQIWRFRTDAGTFHELFASKAVKVRDVVAAAYDSSRGRLIVIDESPSETTVVARVLMFNVRTGDARVLAELPRTRTYSKLAVTARDDGSFLLVGSETRGMAHQVWRFTADVRRGLRWTGGMSGQGKLLNEPINSNDGVVMAIGAGGALQMVTVTDGMLTPSSSGPAGL